MKAMLLCAGRGERMRPLTDVTPKPLLTVNGVPLLVRLITRLKSAGFTELVINVSHLGDQVISALGDGSDWGVSIRYSEEETPLETAGGVIKALPLLGSDPFLIVSGDVYTDYDFSQCRDKPLSGMLAHCVMVSNPSYHPKGDFHMNAGQQLTLEGEPRLTYGNIGIYDPQLFANRPIERIGLGVLLREAIAQQRVSAEYYSGVWHNVGTAQDLKQLNILLSENMA